MVLEYGKFSLTGSQNCEYRYRYRLVRSNKLTTLRLYRVKKTLILLRGVCLWARRLEIGEDSPRDFTAVGLDLGLECLLARVSVG